MKKVVYFLLFLVIFSCNVYAKTTVKSVDFVRCVDGDTALFREDEEEVKYRFLAIDTPETVHPTKGVEAFGKDASEYTCNKLTNAKEIYVEYENGNKTDKYGRRLAWIWVDGSLLQEELIKIGYAKVAYIYGKYSYTESLCLIQNEAYSSKLGMWSEEKDQGYCSTVDLSNVENNIVFSNDGYLDTSDNIKSENEENLANKINKTKDSVNNIEKKVDEILDNNQEVFVYIIIAISIAAFIYKEFKRR